MRTLKEEADKRFYGPEQPKPATTTSPIQSQELELSALRLEVMKLSGVVGVLLQTTEQEREEDEFLLDQVVSRGSFPRSFECYINAEGHLIRRAGWRCVTRKSDWEHVPDELDCGEAVSGQKPWMAWKHTVDEETPGEWEEGENDPPEESIERMVFVFCEVVISTGEAPYLVVRHTGDVRAMDISPENC